MPTNAATVPQTTVDEVVSGLMSEYMPVIDQIAGIQSFTESALTGFVPVRPSPSTLARVSDEDAEGLPEGAEPDEIEHDWSELEYRIRRYPGYGTITDGVREAASRGQLDELENVAAIAMATSAAKVNRKLHLLLSSTVVNENQAPLTGVWSLETSTPVKDLQAAKRKVGGRPNLGVFGLDIVEALSQHPDFLARASYFEAGVVDESEIAAILRKICGISQVIIGGHLYNAAPDGLPLELGFEFDGLAWIGHSRHLVKVEQSGTSPHTEQGRNVRREATELIFSRRLDLRRSHKECGCVLPGVVA